MKRKRKIHKKRLARNVKFIILRIMFKNNKRIIFINNKNNYI